MVKTVNTYNCEVSVLISYDKYVDSVRFTDFSSKNDGSLDSYDSEAINNSILNILLTHKGTIPFNYNFGAGISSYVFETMDTSVLSSYLNRILDEVEFYETRISIDRKLVEVDIKSSDQTVDIFIPYSIVLTGVGGEFYKRLILG